MPKKVLIIAGEPSGDLHASHLVKELKRLEKDIDCFGLGGHLMKEAGVRILYDIADIALVGLIEVLKNLLTLNKVYRATLHEIDRERPDLAILVDYPGFNLRLARELKERSIPVVYYISPQLWAWGEDRITIIKETVRTMLVLFKFEEAFYRTHGVDVEFVGHPLVETARSNVSRAETCKKYGLDPARKIVMLMPGSRKMEVASFLPIMLETARLVERSIPGTQFVISQFAGFDETVYRRWIKTARLDLRLAKEDTYNLLGASDFAIVKSGTVTLETALIGTPMILIYKAGFITYIAFLLVYRLKFIGITNIIAGREIVPEFIQGEVRARTLADKTIEIMASPEKSEAMKREFALIRESLGPGGSYERAARAVVKVLAS